MSSITMPGFSPGTQLNRLLDSLGLPDQLGDILGTQIDMQIGNVKGAMRNLVDAYSGLTTAQMDRFFGREGMPLIGKRGFVPRLHYNSPHLRMWQETYYTSRRAYSIGDDLKDGRMDGRVWTMHVRGGTEAKVPWGSIADWADGRIDGKYTQKWRWSTHAAPPGGFSGIPFLSHLINRHFHPISDIPNRINQIFGGGIGAEAGVSGAGGTGGSIGSIADSNLSLEEKLMLLMAKMAEKMDKEIEGLMRQLESASGEKKKGFLGGFLGGMGKAVGSFFGPIGGLIGGAVDGIFGGGGKGGDKSNQQVLQIKLQRAMEKRQQMFTAITSILKSLHDASMAAIRNLKA